MTPDACLLTDEDRSVYEWQLDVSGFGERGQARLKEASVLVTRCGGLGGVVAYELAAAGVGSLVLAHGGNLRANDLNRQLLMTHDWIGKPRVDCAARRLKELNPRLHVEVCRENVSDANVNRLVDQVDLAVDCAPLFEERYALNAACVRVGTPMVECAVNELELHLTTVIPGQSPCLRCLYPAPSQTWRRRFPIFGAVSGAAGGLAAMEAIKTLSGLGRPLIGELLTGDLRAMSFRRYRVRRDPACPVCSHLGDSREGAS